VFPRSCDTICETPRLSIEFQFFREFYVTVAYQEYLYSLFLDSVQGQNSSSTFVFHLNFEFKFQWKIPATLPHFLPCPGQDIAPAIISAIQLVPLPSSFTAATAINARLKPDPSELSTLSSSLATSRQYLGSNFLFIPSTPTSLMLY
jgi:hypothetical protein